MRFCLIEFSSKLRKCVFSSVNMVFMLNFNKLLIFHSLTLKEWIWGYKYRAEITYELILSNYRY